MTRLSGGSRVQGRNNLHIPLGGSEVVSVDTALVAGQGRGLNFTPTIFKKAVWINVLLLPELG